jgi:hypothetical protein
MKFSISIILVFVNLFAIGQEKEIDFKILDSLYREDQFYLGLSYTNLQKPPSGFSQLKISSNVVFGFLRDMPLNKSRTWSIAPGLGYKISVLNQNLSVLGDDTKTYSILSTDFDKNKFILHYIELPIEIRWRNSTMDSHRFWRIYSGFKLSYLVYDHYKFDAPGITIRQKGNQDLDKLQYGVYLASGWNTWNVYLYYGLNPLFKSAEINGEKIKMNAFNIGLQFYIL